MPWPPTDPGFVMNLRLRPWEVSDAAPLAALFDDPLVYRFTPIQPPFDAVAAARRIAVATHGETSRTVLCRAVLDGEQIVGEVAAYARDDGASVSYVIGDAHRGHGFARQATVLLLDEVRRAWSATRFVAEIAPENPASQRVVESLGFVLDPTASPIPRAGKDYSVLPWHLGVTRQRPGGGRR